MGSWFYDRAQSGGQLVDQTTHILNMAQVMCGSAVSVFASGTRQRLLKDAWVKCEDVSCLVVKYRNGKVGCFANSWAYHEHIFQISFYGCDFALNFDLKDNRLFGEADGVRVDYHGLEDPKQEQMMHFIDAVRSHDQNRIAVGYADGVETLKLTLGANRSLDSRKEERL